jgi:hypothetical protein
MRLCREYAVGYSVSSVCRCAPPAGDNICAHSTLVVHIETYSIADAICATDAIVVSASCTVVLLSVNILCAF